MSARRHAEKLTALLRLAAPDTPVFANVIPPEMKPLPETAFVFIEATEVRPQNFQGSSSGATVFRVQAHAPDYTTCLALTEAVEETASEVRPKALITGSAGGYNRELRFHIRELTVSIR